MLDAHETSEMSSADALNSIAVTASAIKSAQRAPISDTYKTSSVLHLRILQIRLNPPPALVPSNALKGKLPLYSIPAFNCSSVFQQQHFWPSVNYSRNKL
jgi:hypothetical protein